MKVVDLRGVLPRVPEFDPEPLVRTKDVWIIHYQGNDVPRDLTDEQAQAIVLGDAEEHIRRNWVAPTLPEVNGGGIMYHWMIAPSGTAFITRDPNDYLWESGSDDGNRRGRAIQVQCGPNTQPTDAQLSTLTELIATEPSFSVTGNNDWSPTQCPGARLKEYIANKEYDMSMSDDDFRKRFLAVYADIGVGALFSKIVNEMIPNLNGRIVALEQSGHTGSVADDISADLAAMKSELAAHDAFIAKIKAL